MPRPKRVLKTSLANIASAALDRFKDTASEVGLLLIDLKSELVENVEEYKLRELFFDSNDKRMEDFMQQVDRQLQDSLNKLNDLKNQFFNRVDKVKDQFNNNEHAQAIMQHINKIASDILEKIDNMQLDRTIPEKFTQFTKALSTVMTEIVNKLQEYLPANHITFDKKG